MSNKKPVILVLLCLVVVTLSVSFGMGLARRYRAGRFPAVNAEHVETIEVLDSRGSCSITSTSEIRAFCEALNGLWTVEIEPYRPMGFQTDVYLGIGSEWNSVVLHFTEGHQLTISTGADHYLRLQEGPLSYRYFYCADNAALMELAASWEAQGT